MFEEVGEETLKSIIDDFVDSCFADMMIGFLFARADKARVKRFEYEHAADFLGVGKSYSGRSIREAHAAHRIMGGHFDRRLTLLAAAHKKHGLREEISLAWLAHHESLRAEVTLQGPGICQ